MMLKNIRNLLGNISSRSSIIYFIAMWILVMNVALTGIALSLIGLNQIIIIVYYVITFVDGLAYICYELYDTLFKPLRDITKSDIQDFMLKLEKVDLSYYRQQFTDLNTTIYPLALTLVVSIFSYNIQSRHHMLQQTILLISLLTATVIIIDLVLNTKLKRLIEQLQYSGKIIGEPSLKNQSILIHALCYRQKNQPDMLLRVCILCILIVLASVFLIIS